MDYPVFVVPGIGNSGASHWQSRWQVAHPDWRRLAVGDWDRVVCDDWVAAMEQQLVEIGRETILVAHSLGCLAVAHWAARHTGRIRGALLVAVPDPAAAAFPHAATTGFAPLPMQTLPFRTVVVASSDDPYGGIDHARACATAWGSKLVEVGPRGHLNAASGLGDWPDGLQLLATLMNS